MKATLRVRTAPRYPPHEDLQVTEFSGIRIPAEQLQPTPCKRSPPRGLRVREARLTGWNGPPSNTVHPPHRPRRRRSHPGEILLHGAPRERVHAEAAARALDRADRSDHAGSAGRAQGSGISIEGRASRALTVRISEPMSPSPKEASTWLVSPSTASAGSGATSSALPSSAERISTSC